MDPRFALAKPAQPMPNIPIENPAPSPHPQMQLIETKSRRDYLRVSFDLPHHITSYSMFSPPNPTDPVLLSLRIDPEVIKQVIAFHMRISVSDLRKWEPVVEYIRQYLSRRIGQIMQEVAYAQRQRTNFCWSEPCTVNGRKQLVSSPRMSHDVIHEEIVPGNGLPHSRIAEALPSRLADLGPVLQPFLYSRLNSASEIRHNMLRSVISAEIRQFDDRREGIPVPSEALRTDPKVSQACLDFMTKGRNDAPGKGKEASMTDVLCWSVDSKKLSGYTTWLRMALDLAKATGPVTKPGPSG
jgi:hypothetical protein